MIEQMDIFGNTIEVKPIDRPSKKFKTMQELFGVDKEHTCKQCINAIRHEYHDKIYQKCLLWKLSHCSATDIKLNQPACKKFEQKEGGNDVFT